MKARSIYMFAMLQVTFLSLTAEDSPNLGVSTPQEQSFLMAGKRGKRIGFAN
jgi:hypothetical protein